MFMGLGFGKNIKKAVKCDLSKMWAWKNDLSAGFSAGMFLIRASNAQI